jgi:hypothetical protein
MIRSGYSSGAAIEVLEILRKVTMQEIMHQIDDIGAVMSD